MLALMFIIVIVGIILYYGSGQAAKDEKRQREELAKAQAELWIAKAKAGQKITDDDCTPYEVKKMQEKEETKKIIKGAVVGSVIAGDAGAVVGATIAKNKIDNEKKK